MNISEDEYEVDDNGYPILPGDDDNASVHEYDSDEVEYTVPNAEEREQDNNSDEYAVSTPEEREQDNETSILHVVEEEEKYENKNLLSNFGTFGLPLPTVKRMIDTKCLHTPYPIFLWQRNNSFKSFLENRTNNTSSACMNSMKQKKSGRNTYESNLPRYLNMEPNTEETVYNVLDLQSSDAWVKFKKHQFEKKRPNGNWADNVQPAFRKAYLFFQDFARNTTCEETGCTCRQFTSTKHAKVFTYCATCTCNHPSHRDLPFSCHDKEGRCLGTMTCTQIGCQKTFARCMFSKMFFAFQDMEKGIVQGHYKNRKLFICNKCWVENTKGREAWLQDQYRIRVMRIGDVQQQPKEIKKNVIVQFERNTISYQALCESAAPYLQEGTEHYTANRYKYLISPFRGKYEKGDIIQLRKCHVNAAFPQDATKRFEEQVKKERVKKLIEQGSMDKNDSEAQCLKEIHPIFEILAIKVDWKKNDQNIPYSKRFYQIKDLSSGSIFASRVVEKYKTPFVSEFMIWGLLATETEVTYVRMKQNHIPSSYDKECMEKVVRFLPSAPSVNESWIRVEEEDGMREIYGKLNDAVNKLKQKMQAVTKLYDVVKSKRKNMLEEFPRNQNNEQTRDYIKEYVLHKQNIKDKERLFWSKNGNHIEVKVKKNIPKNYQTFIKVLSNIMLHKLHRDKARAWKYFKDYTNWHKTMETAKKSMIQALRKITLCNVVTSFKRNTATRKVMKVFIRTVQRHFLFQAFARWTQLEDDASEYSSSDDDIDPDLWI